MANTVYKLGKDLRLGLSPDISEADDPVLHSNMADVYNAIQQLAAVSELVGVDVDLERALGNIAGQQVFEKYGRNPDVDTGTLPESVWNGGGVYTGFPTGAAETMELLSSDAADAAAGTGARTVTVSNLLDEDGAVAPDITVTLNGTSAVSLGAVTYTRASRLTVVTAGSGGSNAGTLTLRHTTTTTNIFAVMPAGRNRTAIACYTVPTGYVLAVNRVVFRMVISGGSNASAECVFACRDFVTDGAFQSVLSPDITVSMPYEYNNGYILFPARTDIRCDAIAASTNNSRVTAEFSGVLVAV